MSEPSNVGIHCTVIPDGVRSVAGETLRLRASVLLAPVLNAPDHVTSSIPVKQWVELISQGTRGVQLFLHGRDGKPKGRIGGPALMLDPALAITGTSNNRDRNASVRAQALWERIFAQADGSFSGLLDALRQAQERNAAMASTNSRAPAPDLRADIHNRAISPAGTVCYPAADLVGSLEESRRAALNDGAGYNERTRLRSALSSERPWRISTASSKGVREYYRALFSENYQSNQPLLSPYEALLPLSGTRAASTREKDRAALVAAILEQAPAPTTTAIAGRQAAIDAGRAFSGQATATEAEAALRIADFRKQAFDIRDREYERPPPPDGDESAPADDARRKLAALDAHPTMAKFLRMIYDVEFVVNFATWSTLLGPLVDGTLQGFISASFSSSQPDVQPTAPTLTAFSLRAGSSPAEWQFEPCSRIEFGTGTESGRSVPLRSGFVELRGRNGTAPGRFSLGVIDAGTAVTGGFAYQQGSDEATSSGAQLSKDPSKAPELRSYGLVLYDLLPDHEVATSLAYAALRQGRLPFRGAGAATLPADTAHFAEDLVSGYRVDVERAHGTRKTWHTITACDRLYRDIHEAYEHDYPDLDDPVDWHPFDHVEQGSRHYRDRDDGFVSAGGMLTANGTAALAVERMFTWPGDSLGVPAEQTEDDGDAGADCVPLDAIHDLAVFQEFRMATEEDRLLAALREGDGYRVVLRARYRNGGGRGFRRDDPAREPNALGDPDSPAKPYPYRRPEEIQGPQLLLLENDPLLEDDRAQPGTKADVLVLRTGAQATTRVRRVLVPPNCSVGRAEQQGLLDGSSARQPDGAFFGVQMSRGGPGFPVVQLPGDGRKEVGRGLVFRPAEDGPENPYYPDTNSRQLGLAFVRDSLVPEGFSEPRDGYSFWESAESPLDARPIILNLVPAGSMREGGEAAVQLARRTIFNGLPAGQLEVSLAPAEEVELLLWCYADFAQVSKSNLFLGRSAERLPITAWSDLSPFPRPLPELQTVTRLRLVHAVPKPLRSPAFRQAGGGGLALGISLLGAPSDWTGTAVKHAAGGNLGFLSGFVDFHRRSTSELRGEATWLDVSGADAVREVGKGRWEFQPPRRTVELFAIRNIPGYLLDVDEPDVLDLARDENGSLRNLSHQFDRRAHFIAVRLVATSRFASYFSPPPENPPAPGPFSVESCPASDITPERLRNATADLRVFSFWLDATIRPPVPVVERIEVKMCERRITSGSTNRIILEKSAPRLRLWLKRGTWFASGQDELFAVLCLPHNLVDPVPKAGGMLPVPRRGHELDPGEAARRSDLARLRMADVLTGTPSIVPATASHPLAQIITAWGTNATHESGVLPSAIPPNCFSGYVAKVQDLEYKFELPAKLDGTPGGTVAASISLLAYRPVLDDSSGEWYVDVDFEGVGVDTPFLRLCVARYQEHAVKDCQLSPHLALSPRGMHPPRTVQVDLESAERITVKVVGPGYHLRAPLSGDAALQSQVNTPLQTFALRRTVGTDGKAGRIQTFDADGGAISARVAADAHPEGKVWTVTLPRPAGVPLSQLVLSITETELGLRVDGPDSATQLSDLTEIPRLFSCDIPLE